METPTSTRELVGDERTEETREPRRFDRDEAGTDKARDDSTASTAAFAANADRDRRDDTTDDTPELLAREDNAEFQSRWEKIQTGFVDEPRRTVEQADELVAEVMKRLAEGFAGERERLEGHWGRGEDVSTEDLRVTLQRYRGFFQRLLSA
ncbi:hypothetical protein [Solirubrobacter soli]|uniref:hypothetical protein n=1 Tax=Solirubrobacter soli TaxID=363832 RepID=UPI0003FF1F8F|nr:hypothetical protein [Solirubrobacter soli]